MAEETSEGDVDYLSNIFEKGSSSKKKVDDSALVFCWDDFMPTTNQVILRYSYYITRYLAFHL